MNIDIIKEILPLISGLIFLAIILARILETVIKAFFKKIKKEKSPAELFTEVLEYLYDGKKSILTEEEKNHLKYLVEFHKKTDNNGIPLSYFPRSYEETQKEIVSVLNKFINYQEKIILLLEYKLDKK